MGTVIERIDMPSRIRKLFLQLLVDELHVRGPVLAECDAALVGNHDDFFPMGVENCDGLFYPGQDVKVFPALDILSFRRFSIDDAISVEEDKHLILQILHKVSSFQHVF